MIVELLKPGQDSGTKLPLLSALTGMTPRAVRRQIQRERHEGACICHNNRDGYYIASSEEERDSCVRSMRHRAGEIHATADAIEAAAIPEKEADDGVEKNV